MTLSLSGTQKIMANGHGEPAQKVQLATGDRIGIAGLAAGIIIASLGGYISMTRDVTEVRTDIKAVKDDMEDVKIDVREIRAEVRSQK